MSIAQLAYGQPPIDLSTPKDDGVCDQLPGRRLPPLRRPLTRSPVDLAALPPMSVLFFYPAIGRPGVAPPNGSAGPVLQ